MRWPVEKTIRAAEAMDDPRYERLLLKPSYEHQSREFAAALEKIWKQGAWCVCIDELWYIQRLGLEAMVERLLTQGRSEGITVVMGMQRPVGVTRFALSQATHMLSFGADGRDCKTLAEAATKEFGEAVSRLQQYEFAWFYRPTRKIWTGKVQHLTRKI